MGNIDKKDDLLSSLSTNPISLQTFGKNIVKKWVRRILNHSSKLFRWREINSKKKLNISYVSSFEPRVALFKRGKKHVLSPPIL